MPIITPTLTSDLAKLGTRRLDHDNLVKRKG
jgi:hypothetical protein